MSTASKRDLERRGRFHVVDESPITYYMPSLVRELRANGEGFRRSDMAVKAAAFLQHLHWRLSQCDEARDFDGRPWIFSPEPGSGKGSQKVWAEYFGWDERAFRRVSSRLQSAGLVETEELNAHSRDRTSWYSLDSGIAAKLSCAEPWNGGALTNPSKDYVIPIFPSLVERTGSILQAAMVQHLGWCLDQNRRRGDESQLRREADDSQWWTEAKSQSQWSDQLAVSRATIRGALESLTDQQIIIKVGDRYTVHFRHTDTDFCRWKGGVRSVRMDVRSVRMGCEKCPPLQEAALPRGSCEPRAASQEATTFIYPVSPLWREDTTTTGTVAGGKKGQKSKDSQESENNNTPLGSASGEAPREARDQDPKPPSPPFPAGGAAESDSALKLLRALQTDGDSGADASPPADNSSRADGSRRILGEIETHALYLVPDRDSLGVDELDDGAVDRIFKKWREYFCEGRWNMVEPEAILAAGRYLAQCARRGGAWLAESTDGGWQHSPGAPVTIWALQYVSWAQAEIDDEIRAAMERIERDTLIDGVPTKFTAYMPDPEDVRAYAEARQKTRRGLELLAPEDAETTTLDKLGAYLRWGRDRGHLGFEVNAVADHDRVLEYLRWRDGLVNSAETSKGVA